MSHSEIAVPHRLTQTAGSEIAPGRVRISRCDKGTCDEGRGSLRLAHATGERAGNARRGAVEGAEMSLGRSPLTEASVSVNGVVSFAPRTGRETTLGRFVPFFLSGSRQAPGQVFATLKPSCGRTPRSAA